MKPYHEGTTPEEMARWIVNEWRSVRGSDRMLIVAITEALKVIPAAVADLEADNAALREALGDAAAEAHARCPGGGPFTTCPHQHCQRAAAVYGRSTTRT